MKKSNSQIAIQLTNVSKKYEIHHEKPTLVEKFIKGKNETFWALRDINLNIKKGEKIGIIGLNGSGKTTLLKIITGITTPTSGTVATHGRIVSLIDLEAGFHLDLTGIQNIFLNGILLGVNSEEIKHQLSAIIKFADIGQFIDAPLFTYSLGMKLRLGFAIAVYANPDILILDEGLGVGDEYFQKRCFAKIQEFFQQKKTILTVSHYTEYIKRDYQRILLLEKGKILHDGGSSVASYYLKSI
jgi:ABC-type polysaccharide/polyol phosphate transport system ATPase subunit